MKKIYILIVNYNNWFDTLECLESVLRIDYPNYQVIVVDNNSSNNSMNYIKNWAEGKLNVWVNPEHTLRSLSFPPIQKPIPYVCYTREEAEKGGNPELENSLVIKVEDGEKFPSQVAMRSTSYPLIFIQTEKNLGFAGGNNVGIRYALAKGDFEYLWLLNNDTVVKRDSLLELYKKANGMDLIVGSLLVFYDKPHIIQAIGGGKLIDILGLPRNLGKGKFIDDYMDREQQIDKKYSLDFIIGASLFVKKSIIERVGLMPEDYFLYWEETDWCYRFKEKGYKLSVSLKSIVYHKESSSIGFKSFYQQKIDFKNMLKFYFKYKKRYLPIIIISKFVINLLSSFKHKKEITSTIRASLKGLFEFLYELFLAKK